MKKYFLLCIVLSFSVRTAFSMQILTNADSDFPKISFAGFARVRYTADTTQGAKDGFSIGQSRFGIIGNISRNISYCFSLEGSNTDTINNKLIYDTYIDIKSIKYFMLRVGQFKYKFSLEQSIPDADLELINKSDIVNNSVKPTRDIGIELSRSFSLKSIKSDVFLAVINGSGLNQAEENSQKTVVGRILFLPVAGLSIGASIYDGSVGLTSITKSRTGFEMKYEFKKFMCKAEYITGSDKTTKQEGYYVTAGYTLIPSVLILLRYDSLDPDINLSNNEIGRWTWGVNYFIDKNVLLRNNYEQKTETPSIQNDLFMTQLQVKF